MHIQLLDLAQRVATRSWRFSCTYGASSSGSRARRVCRWRSLEFISRWHVHVQAIARRNCIHACVGANSAPCCGAPGKHARQRTPAELWARDIDRLWQRSATRRDTRHVLQGGVQGCVHTVAALSRTAATFRRPCVSSVGLHCWKAEDHLIDGGLD